MRADLRAPPRSTKNGQGVSADCSSDAPFGGKNVLPADRGIRWIMQDEANPWTILASERIYENAFLSLVNHTVRDASGRESQYAVTRYKQIGIRILPIDSFGQT